ncbi:hypothetical protein [Anaeromyxobacter oryzisoli]|uniref:hypothetical protein n=1 Tax=Anaeromyxobacter oryzisoli TaxID=2925408 RepID=UPI001F55F9CD|nr:hypothetical protein [Anaeromyxobacter sp. SG63]
MAKRISPELELRYSRELTKTLTQIDGLTADLKEEMKARKGEIATLQKAAYRLRMLLDGKESEQTEIPGAEIPSVRERETR